MTKNTTTADSTDGVEAIEWYSITTMAEVLSVSQHTLYKWLAKGEFPVYCRLPNNQVRVHREDLEVWMLSLRITQ